MITYGKERLARLEAYPHIEVPIKDTSAVVSDNNLTNEKRELQISIRNGMVDRFNEIIGKIKSAEDIDIEGNLFV